MSRMLGRDTARGRGHCLGLCRDLRDYLAPRHAAIAPCRTTEPRIAPAPGGGAYAVWIQNDGTRFDGIASRYVPGSGWETPAPFETESGDTFDPRVAVNRSGAVQATWRQHDGLRFNVWASRYE